MGNPISGGYPVPGDLGNRLKGTEAAVAQLQRLMTREQKIPQETGGGPMGTTRAQCFTPLITHGSGSTTLAADGWDIKSMWGDAPAVTPVLPSKLAVSVEGFYSFAVSYYLTWDAGLAPAIVDTGADYQGRVDDYPRWKDATTDGDLVKHYTFGPIFLPAGGWVSFGSTWANLNAAYINYFSVDVSRVG